PAPQALSFLGNATQAQLDTIARELGPLAELLTPNRLYALGLSVGDDYLTLARRLNTLLSRVEGPYLVLARLEDLLEARRWGRLKDLREAARGSRWPEYMLEAKARRYARGILKALEGTANPRPILEAVTPELLDLGDLLPGGVRELFEAM